MRRGAEELYHHRNDAESTNTQLDAYMENRRMIALGTDARMIVTLGCALARNATTAHLHSTR